MPRVLLGSLLALVSMSPPASGGALVNIGFGKLDTKYWQNGWYVILDNTRLKTRNADGPHASQAAAQASVAIWLPYYPDVKIASYLEVNNKDPFVDPPERQIPGRGAIDTTGWKKGWYAIYTNDYNKTRIAKGPYPTKEAYQLYWYWLPPLEVKGGGDKDKPKADPFKKPMGLPIRAKDPAKR